MIQAVEPATATAACETGTWRRPAGSSRLAAGSKAQIVETVDVGGEADSLPVPPLNSRGAELGRAEPWSRPLDYRAVAAGYEYFAAHGHGCRAGQGLGEVADDSCRVPGRVHDLDHVHWSAGPAAGDRLTAEDEDLPVQRGGRRVAHRDREMRRSS